MPADQDGRAQVSRTPLSEQGVSLQSQFVSARRGLATNIGNLERSSEHARVLNNFQMIRLGVWTNTGIGWTEQRATTFNSGTEFLEFGRFIDSSGTRTLLFQVGSKLYSYDLSTSTETEIKASLSDSAYPTIRRSYSPVSGQSIAIYCNGDIEPRKITDVTTPTEAALAFNAGTWPGTFNSKSYSKPKFCEPFGTRFVYGGFSGATVAFDILISDFGDPEDFTLSTPVVATDAVAFTYPPELGQLTSLRVVTLSNDSNDQVIIGGCTDGIFAIFGNDATDFGLKILTREVGVLSNRCFVQVGDEIIYLSTTGFRALSALTLNATLAQDALSFGIQDLVDLIDTDNAHKSHAVHYPKTQEIQFWVPIAGDSGTPKHAFILKYEATGGSLIPIWSTKDGTEVTASIVFNGVMYGGNSNGKLQIHYSGETYNGSAINGGIALALVGLGNPAQQSGMQQLTVVTDGSDQKFNIKANQFTVTDIGTMRSEIAEPGVTQLEAAQVAGTTLGSWILGTGAFPFNHVKTLRFSPMGTGVWWDFELTISESDHRLDFAGVGYTLSGGGLSRK